MPSVLRTHYQQYKRDTNQLSTWLAKAAVSLGFPIDAINFTAGRPLDEAVPTRTAQQIRNAKKTARKKAKAKVGGRVATVITDAEGENGAGRDLEDENRERGRGGLGEG